MDEDHDEVAVHAHVYPHRIVKVLVDGDSSPTKFEVGEIGPCLTCSHAFKSHPAGYRCTEPECSCMRHRGHRSDITADDAAAVAAKVAELLMGRGVRSITLERDKRDPSKSAYAKDSLLIGDAILGAIGGLEQRVDDREPYRIDVVTVDYEPSPAPLAPPAPTTSPFGAEVNAAAYNSIATPPAAQQPAEPEPEPVAGPPVEPTGPRVAGIDPGSRYVAVTIAEPVADRLRFIAKHTFVIGRLVNGKVNVEAVDIAALGAELGTLLQEHQVARVALERPEAIWGKSNARATQVATSMYVSGGIVLACQNAGCTTETVAESTWHAVVVPGRRKKRDRVGALGPAVAAALEGWPERSNEHERDAAGLAIWLTAPPKPKTRRARAVTPKSTEKKAHAARATTRAKKRTESGCTCKGRRRHATTCPARLAPP